MATKTIVPGYIDEAGANGYLRNLTPDRDSEIGLMCAIVVAPATHDRLIDALRPHFESFRKAAPPGAKLHITDAFKPGNEEWAAVARIVREEYIKILASADIWVIYSARRLSHSRELHEITQKVIKQGREAKTSRIAIPGSNRPSAEMADNTPFQVLTLKLDALVQDELLGKLPSPEIEMRFDETDSADRYRALAEATRRISYTSTSIVGRDIDAAENVHGAITFSVLDGGDELNVQYVGQLLVVGKDHPLVLAADIVANSLLKHLGDLELAAPLNAPSSIRGWGLESVTWGVMDGATEDVW